MADTTVRRSAWDCVALGLVAAAAVVTARGAIPYAGGYSDGSRLAAIESVGARGTLAIDDSLFAKFQPQGDGVIPAYDPKLYEHLSWGTNDKMFVRGHFYSHHPPVPLLAGGLLYKLWLTLGGPTSDERPDLFVFWVTVATAALPYALAVWCVWRLGRRAVGLSGPAAVLLALSFAAATVAPTYTRQVNGHILLLAVGAAVCLLVAQTEAAATVARGRLLALGTLAGAGYCLDGAIGPALVLCVLGYCAAAAGWRGAALAALAAAPWGLAHHGTNYAVAGELFSPASNPDNWKWPGSPFDPENLTGVGVKHPPAGFVNYAGEMLVGPRGFLLYNLPLALALAAAVYLARRCPEDRRAVAFACGWVLLGAAPYALLSNNLGGTCLSVRWFVPFLAPGFWLVALLVRRRPRCLIHLAWLTAWGLVIGYRAFNAGPWQNAPLPGLDLVAPVAFVGWGVIAVAESGRNAASG